MRILSVCELFLLYFSSCVMQLRFQCYLCIINYVLFLFIILFYSCLLWVVRFRLLPYRHSIFEFSCAMITIWISELKKCSFFLYKNVKYIVCIKCASYVPFYLLFAGIRRCWYRHYSNSYALRQRILFSHSSILYHDSNSREFTHCLCARVVYGFNSRLWYYYCAKRATEQI